LLVAAAVVLIPSTVVVTGSTGPETGFTATHQTNNNNSKTDVTPSILSRDFIAQLYRATKSQV